VSSEQKTVYNNRGLSVGNYEVSHTVSKNFMNFGAQTPKMAQKFYALFAERSQ